MRTCGSLFQDLYRDLQSDDARNALICRAIIAAVKEGRTLLLLTERKSHLEELARRLEPDVEHKITLCGEMSRKELKAALERLSSLPPSMPRVILATGRFIGEGFDDSRLDRLFLALPVS